VRAERILDPEGAGQSLTFERPPRPLRVLVRAPGFDAQTLGPLHPSAVGGTLPVRLELLPRLRGRVTHEGRPVAGAEVQLQQAAQPGATPLPAIEDWRRRRSMSYWLPSARTNAEGRFELVLSRSGRFRVEVHAHGVGEGAAGPFPVDPAQDSEELHVELTRALGSVAGIVRVPPGQRPESLWLSTSGGRGLMSVGRDGRFVLPDLPAGPTAVRAYAGETSLTELIQARTPGADPSPSWFSVTHFQPRRPGWLDYAWSSRVDVRAGETVTLELDLVTEPARRLQGRLLLDGAHHAPSEGTGSGSNDAPRATLEHADGAFVVSDGELDAEGRFMLGVHEPGEYVLRSSGVRSGGRPWIVLDRVWLAPGTTRWEQDVATGALEVLPVGGPDGPKGVPRTPALERPGRPARARALPEPVERGRPDPAPARAGRPGRALHVRGRSARDPPRDRRRGWRDDGRRCGPRRGSRGRVDREPPARTPSRTGPG